MNYNSISTQDDNNKCGFYFMKEKDDKKQLIKVLIKANEKSLQENQLATNLIHLFSHNPYMEIIFINEFHPSEYLNWELIEIFEITNQNTISISHYINSLTKEQNTDSFLDLAIDDLDKINKQLVHSPVPDIKFHKLNKLM